MGEVVGIQAWMIDDPGELSEDPDGLVLRCGLRVGPVAHFQLHTMIWDGSGGPRTGPGVVHSSTLVV